MPRYFSCVPGRTVARYGSDSFIGATRTATGMVFDPDKIVAVSDKELGMYFREYRNAVRRKELLERTEAEYKATLSPTVTQPAEPPAKVPETTTEEWGDEDVQVVVGGEPEAEE